MAAPYVIVPDFGIDHGRVDIGMTEEPLHLLHGHAVMQQDGRNRVPEDVRGDPDRERPAGCLDDPVKGILHGAGRHVIGRAFQRFEDVRGIVRTGSEVRPKRDLRFRIEIGPAGYVAFAVFDEHGFLFPVDIVDPGVAEFRDTNAGGVQEIHHGFIPETVAGVAEIFQFDTFHGFAGRLFLFDGVDSADGIGRDDSFQCAPFEQG